MTPQSTLSFLVQHTFKSVLLSLCLALVVYIQAVPTEGRVNRCVGSYDSGSSSAKPAQAVRWAIVALAKPNDARLKIRNAAIAEKLKPFASKHDITAIFFSELQIPDQLEKEWQSTFSAAGIKFKSINTAADGFYNLPSTGESNQVDEITYGYKYMCKFFALDIYKYLQNYDYYLRIDSDCYLKHVKMDIFQWAVDNNLGYGYLSRKLEAHGPTRMTLPVLTQKYMQKCDITPSSPMEVPLSTCFNFYNNLHMGRVSFFHRPEVLDFLRAVNSSGRILTHRWGDSTIQAYAVRLFMEPNAVMRIPNLTYVHGSHSNMIISSIPGTSSNLPQALPVFNGDQYSGVQWKVKGPVNGDVI